MEVLQYKNADLFLKDYETVMLEHEAVSQLILFNAYQNRNIPVNETCLFGAVLENKKMVLLFCNVTPYNLVIYTPETNKELVSNASKALAEYIIHHNVGISGVNAKYEICQSFIERYKEIIGCAFRENLAMDIMEIREVNDIKPAEGEHRLATLEEEKLITDWMIQFNIEALESEIDYEAALIKMKKYIMDGKVHVFENSESAIVTMAVVTRQLPHGIAISYVFTPEEYRGKGYAAANIYYISKQYLENGKEFCTLFVDKRNPVSNRAYEKVGFQILEDNFEFKVLPQEL